jgi:type II secretory pathway component PulK
MKKPASFPVRGQRGVAMLMALVTMLLLSILAGELVYQSGVYSAVVFRQRDQLRAVLLAKTGMRLALLQLKAAKKAKAQAKNMGLGENTDIVDRIWQTPLILPPPDIPGLSGIDKSAVDEFKKSIGLDGTVTVNIAGSNDRMSINQLVWLEAGGKVSAADKTTGGTGDRLNTGALDGRGNTDTGAAGMGEEQKKERMKKIRDGFVEVFEELFQKKRQEDDAFREKYANLSGAWVVGNLLAWMDPETKEDGDNREKNDYYSGLGEPYSLKNAPIASENEYPMIKGLDDTIAKLIADNFTVLATSSLNVNKASLQLLGSMIPELTPDSLERIGKRRADPSMGGQFKNADDFWQYVMTLGSYEDAKKKFDEKGIKILDAESSYRAVITAESGLSKKTWMADIGGLPPADPKATSTATSQAPQQQPQPQAGNTGTSTNTSTKADSGDSDSLNILYLRTD